MSWFVGPDQYTWSVPAVAGEASQPPLVNVRLCTVLPVIVNGRGGRGISLRARASADRGDGVIFVATREIPGRATVDQDPHRQRLISSPRVEYRQSGRTSRRA